MSLRSTTAIASVVLGALMALGGLSTWLLVSSTLADQRITVADDAPCLAGETVDGPLTAYCQAQIIEEHALAATDGQTYAELGRDDPGRDTAMRASFLRASLFTSVLAFGVSAMAAVLGLLFVLIGLGVRDVEQLIELPEAQAVVTV